MYFLLPGVLFSLDLNWKIWFAFLLRPFNLQQANPVTQEEEGIACARVAGEIRALSVHSPCPAGCSVPLLGQWTERCCCKHSANTHTGQWWSSQVWEAQQRNLFLSGSVVATSPGSCGGSPGAAAGASPGAGSCECRGINGKCHVPLLFLQEQHQKWSSLCVLAELESEHQCHHLLAAERAVRSCAGKNKGGSCFQLSEMEMRVFCVTLWWLRRQMGIFVSGWCMRMVNRPVLLEGLSF